MIQNCDVLAQEIYCKMLKSDEHDNYKSDEDDCLREDKTVGRNEVKNIVENNSIQEKNTI